MAFGMIGKKLGMTQVFDQLGNLVAATLVEVAPNAVVQVKSAAGKDGYDALKLAVGEAKPGRINKPELGVFKALNQEPKRYVREFRVSAETAAKYEVGSFVDSTIFFEGDKVDVVGTSKGRGFAGVVKRHGFKGAKEASHGTHEYKRHGGSIGCSAYPGRVIKGKRMAGQMGNVRVSTQGLHVLGVYPEENLLVIKGAIPGAKDGLVLVKETFKRG